MNSQPVLALDLIFSCNICHLPFSQLGSDQGKVFALRRNDGRQAKDQITKLWLTECAHLSCPRHFEGGGVPFYPEGQSPRAPCPRCLQDRNDTRDKTLYHIDGLAAGLHDRQISEVFFKDPLSQLKSTNAEQEALRFQYLSLVRFGFDMFHENQRLQKVVTKWDSRKDDITRTLNMMVPLKKELLMAGQKLRALNEDVSSIEKVLGLNATSPVIDDSGLSPSEMQSSTTKTISGESTSTRAMGQTPKEQATRMAMRQSSNYFAPQDRSLYHHSAEPSDRSPPTKRQKIIHMDEETPIRPQSVVPAHRERLPSRQLMPPPPRPSLNISPNRDYQAVRPVSDQDFKESYDPNERYPASVHPDSRHPSRSQTPYTRGVILAEPLDYDADMEEVFFTPEPQRRPSPATLPPQWQETRNAPPPLSRQLYLDQESQPQIPNIHLSDGNPSRPSSFAAAYRVGSHHSSLTSPNILQRSPSVLQQQQQYTPLPHQQSPFHNFPSLHQPDPSNRSTPHRLSLQPPYITPSPTLNTSTSTPNNRTTTGGLSRHARAGAVFEAFGHNNEHDYAFPFAPGVEEAAGRRSGARSGFDRVASYSSGVNARTGGAVVGGRSQGQGQGQYRGGGGTNATVSAVPFARAAGTAPRAKGKGSQKMRGFFAPYRRG